MPPGKTGELESVRRRWIAEVYGRPDEIDPSGEIHWPSMLLGFLLGAGCSVDEAAEIAMLAPTDAWPV